MLCYVAAAFQKQLAQYNILYATWTENADCFDSYGNIANVFK